MNSNQTFTQEIEMTEPGQPVRFDMSKRYRRPIQEFEFMFDYNEYLSFMHKDDSFGLIMSKAEFEEAVAEEVSIYYHLIRRDYMYENRRDSEAQHW